MLKTVVKVIHIAYIWGCDFFTMVFPDSSNTKLNSKLLICFINYVLCDTGKLFVLPKSLHVFKNDRRVKKK